MRIGIDGRLWNETGVGRYIRNLVRQLSVIDTTNEYVLFIGTHDAERIKKQELRSKEKWKIVPVDIRWHSIEEQIKFPQIINKENLDLVHFPYFSIPVGYKKPYVITIHDLILNHYPTGKASTLPLPLYQLKRLGYKYVLSNAIKNAEKIIVPLNAVKGDLIKTLRVPSNKIVVTEEGVEEVLSGKYKVLSEQEINKRYFLYVGNAYPHKNLEKLIQAFDRLRKNNKDIALILVGKDDYFYDELQKKIINEGFDGISFKNNVSDLELFSLYKNALAFISPSLMEGFGLPVLEAMASKCLVLVSDIPSFREVAKDSAIYFDPNSLSDMEMKMKQVVNLSEKEKNIFITKGIKLSHDFSWRRMSEQTLKIYESCVLARSEKQ